MTRCDRDYLHLQYEEFPKLVYWQEPDLHVPELHSLDDLRSQS